MLCSLPPMLTLAPGSLATPTLSRPVTPSWTPTPRLRVESTSARSGRDSPSEVWARVPGTVLPQEREAPRYLLDASRDTRYSPASMDYGLSFRDQRNTCTWADIDRMNFIDSASVAGISHIAAPNGSIPVTAAASDSAFCHILGPILGL